MLRQILSVATLLVAGAMAYDAQAGDAALAESLFQQGVELMDQGDYAAACPKLKESLAQDPAMGTLLALSLCQEQTGLTASAWAGYAEVVARARRDGRPDREQAAREKMQALEPRLSRLTIVVDASTASLPGLVVKRDEVAIGAGAWGTPSPVDPGEHVVDVTAPGKRRWKGKVTIGAAADSQTLTVPPLDDEPPAPLQGAAATEMKSPAPPDAAAGSVTADDVSPPASSPLRTIGIVVGAVGIVGLGVSAYLGVHGKGLYTDSNRDGHCDASDKCDPTGIALRESAVRETDAATVALVAGGVLTAAGLTLFFVSGPKAAKANAARVEASPALGPGIGAVLVRGRF